MTDGKTSLWRSHLNFAGGELSGQVKIVDAGTTIQNRSGCQLKVVDVCYGYNNPEEKTIQ